MADYVLDVEPSSDMAAATEDSAIRESLLALANEEAKHTLHFEIQFDDAIKFNLE